MMIKRMLKAKIKKKMTNKEIQMRMMRIRKM